MSETLTIEQAAKRLPELIQSLRPTDQIILKKDDHEIAHIVIGESVPSQPRRIPGIWKDKLIIISDDDEHLDDFKDYMP